MSDDLIKRLGKSVWTLDQAEDRIKELEESNKELTLQLLAAHGQAADALDRAVVAEAKLAKAVETIKKIKATVASSKVPIAGLIRHQCKVAPAELEGGE
jgi:hypothetical protein